MPDWLRSLSVLAAGFGAVVALTLGLAGMLVPRSTASTGGDVPASGGVAGVTPSPEVQGIPGLGGALTVTGDREGTFRLTRDTTQNGYALVGDDGRIAFEGAPAEVTQVSYDGLEFFPDPGQCRLSVGDLDNAVGIGFAELRCDDLADVRDDGVISLVGEIGLPVDRLAARQLPATGGTASIGSETWTFADARLVTWQQPAIAGVQEYAMELADTSGGGILGFDYDFMTHRLWLANVERGGEDLDVPEGACAFDRSELGKHNPRTTVAELSFSCPAVEVPGMGTVAISGTVVVDELEWPE